MSIPVLLLPNGGLGNLSSEEAVDSVYQLLPPQIVDAGQRDDLGDEEFTAAEVVLRAGSSVPSTADALRAFKQASKALRGAENACNAPDRTLSGANCTERIQAAARVAAASIRARYLSRPIRPLEQVGPILRSIPFMSMGDAHVAPTGVASLETAFSTWHTLESSEKVQLSTVILLALSPSCSQLQPESLAWPNSHGRVAAILDDTVTGLLSLMAEDTDLSTIQRSTSIQLLCRLVLARSKPCQVSRFISILARSTSGVAEAKLLRSAKQTQLWPLIAKCAANTKAFKSLTQQSGVAADPLAGVLPARLLPAKAAKPRRSPAASTAAAAASADSRPQAKAVVKTPVITESLPSASSTHVDLDAPFARAAGGPQVAVAGLARLRSRPRATMTSPSSAPLQQSASTESRPQALLGGSIAVSEDERPVSAQAAAAGHGGAARSSTPYSETGDNHDSDSAFFEGTAALVAACLSCLTAAQAGAVLGQMPIAFSRIASGSTAQAPNKYTDWLAACVCEHIQLILESKLDHDRSVDSVRHVPVELWDAAVGVKQAQDELVSPPETAHTHALTIPLALGDLLSAFRVNSTQLGPVGRSTRSLVAAGQNTFNELCDPTLNFPTHSSGSDLSHLDQLGIVSVAAGNEHTVLLTEMGQVLSAGYNAQGSCGFGKSGPQTALQAVHVPADHGKPTQVFAANGCEHTVILTDRGRVLASGSNKSGQLGIGSHQHEDMPQAQQQELLFRPISALFKVRVMAVGVSYNHSLFATDDGLFACGKASCFGAAHEYGTVVREPVRLRLPSRAPASPAAGRPSSQEQHVQMVSCGQEHSLVLMDDGSVLAAGSNQYGQLGAPLSDPSDVLAQSTGFLRVNNGALSNRAVQQITCGYFHSLALTEAGVVVAFGRNDYGQLGLGRSCTTCFVPTAVPVGQRDDFVVSVGAGCYHSIVATKSKCVFGFGRNQHGQLFMPPSGDVFSPSRAELPRTEDVEHISCGFYHSLISFKRKTNTLTLPVGSAVRSAEISTIFPDKTSPALLAPSVQRLPGKHSTRMRKTQEKVRVGSCGVLFQVSGCSGEVVSVGAALAATSDYLCNLFGREGDAPHRSTVAVPSTKEAEKAAFPSLASLQVSDSVVGQWPSAAAHSAVAALITCASVNSKRFWTSKAAELLPRKWSFLDATGQSSTTTSIPIPSVGHDTENEALQTPFSDIASNQYRFFCSTRLKHSWLVAQISLSALSACATTDREPSLCHSVLGNFPTDASPELVSSGLVLAASRLCDVPCLYAWTWLLCVLRDFPAAAVDPVLEVARRWELPEVDVYPAHLSALFLAGCQGSDQAWPLLAQFVTCSSSVATQALNDFLTDCCSAMTDLPSNRSIGNVLDLCLLFLSAKNDANVELATRILTLQPSWSATFLVSKLVALSDAASASVMRSTTSQDPLHNGYSRGLCISAEHWELVSARSPVEALLGSASQAAACAAILAPPDFLSEQAVQPLLSCFNLVWEHLLEQEMRTNIILRVSLQRGKQMGTDALGFSGEKLLLDPEPFLRLYCNLPGQLSGRIASACSPCFSQASSEALCYGFENTDEALVLALKSLFLVEILESRSLADLLDCMLALQVGSGGIALSNLQRHLKRVSAKVLKVWRVWNQPITDGRLSANASLSRCAFARQIHRFALERILANQSAISREKTSRWGFLRAVFASWSSLKSVRPSKQHKHVENPTNLNTPFVLRSALQSVARMMSASGADAAGPPGVAMDEMLKTWKTCGGNGLGEHGIQQDSQQKHTELLNNLFESNFDPFARASPTLPMQLLAVRLKLLSRLSSASDLRIVHMAAERLSIALLGEELGTYRLLHCAQLLEILVACFMRRSPQLLPERLLRTILELSQRAGDDSSACAHSVVCLFGLALVRKCSTVERNTALAVASFAEKLLSAIQLRQSEAKDQTLFQHFGTLVPQPVYSTTTADSLVCALRQVLCEGRYHFAGAFLSSSQASLPTKPPVLELCTSNIWEQHVWVYSAADANGKTKIVLHRGASAAFSCPLVLLRPNGSVELAIATDRNQHQAASEWHSSIHWLKTCLGPGGADLPKHFGRTDDLVWTVIEGAGKILPHRWHLLRICVAPNMKEQSTRVSLAIDGGEPAEVLAVGLPRPAWDLVGGSWVPAEPPLSVGALPNSRHMFSQHILGIETGAQMLPFPSTCFSQELVLEDRCSSPSGACSFSAVSGIRELDNCSGFDGQIILGAGGPSEMYEARYKEGEHGRQTFSVVLVMAAECLQKTSNLSASDLLPLTSAIVQRTGQARSLSCDLVLRLLLRALSACESPACLLEECGLLSEDSSTKSSNACERQYTKWVLYALGVSGLLGWKIESVSNGHSDAGQDQSEAQLCSDALFPAKYVRGNPFRAIHDAQRTSDFLQGLLWPGSDDCLHDCFAERSARLAIQSVLLEHARQLLQSDNWRDNIISSFLELGLPLRGVGGLVHGDMEHLPGLGRVGIGASVHQANDESSILTIFRASAVLKFFEAMFSLPRPIAEGSRVDVRQADFTSLACAVQSQLDTDSWKTPPATKVVVKRCCLHDAVLVSNARHVQDADSDETQIQLRFNRELVRTPGHTFEPPRTAPQLLTALDIFQHLRQDSCVCPLGACQLQRGKEVDCTLALRRLNRDRIRRSDKSAVWVPRTQMCGPPLDMAVPAVSSEAARVLQAMWQLSMLRQPADADIDVPTHSAPMTHMPINVLEALSLKWVQNDAIGVLKQLSAHEGTRELGGLLPAAMRISSPVFLESAEVRLHAHALRLRCSQLLSSPHYFSVFHATAKARQAIGQGNFRDACATVVSHVECAAQQEGGISGATAQQDTQQGTDIDFSSTELSQANVLMAVLGFAQTDLADIPGRIQLEPLQEMGFQLHWCLVASRLCHHDLALASTWLLDNSPFLHAVQEQLDADASSVSVAEQLGASETHSQSLQGFHAEGGSDSSGHLDGDSDSSLQSSDDDDESAAGPDTAQLWQLAHRADTNEDNVDEHGPSPQEGALGSLLRALQLLGDDAGTSNYERTPPRQHPAPDTLPLSPFSPASMASNSTMEDAQSDYGHFEFDSIGNLVAVSSPSRHTAFASSAADPQFESGSSNNRSRLTLVDSTVRLHIPNSIDCISLVHLVQAVVTSARANASAEASEPVADTHTMTEAPLEHSDTREVAQTVATVEPVAESATPLSGTAARQTIASGFPSAVEAPPEYSPSTADYSAAGSALDVVRRRRSSPDRSQAAGVPPEASSARDIASGLQRTSLDENSLLSSIQRDIDQLLPRISEAHDQLASLMLSPRALGMGRLVLPTSTDVVLELNIETFEAKLLAPFAGGDVLLATPVAPIGSSWLQQPPPAPASIAASVWKLAQQHCLGACYSGLLCPSAKEVWAGPCAEADSLHARAWGTVCDEESPIPQDPAFSGSRNFPCHMLATHVLDEDHFPSDRVQALVPSMELSPYFKSGKNVGGWDAFGQRLFDQDATCAGQASDALDAVDPFSPPWLPLRSRRDGNEHAVPLNSLRRSTELAMCQFLQYLIVQADCRPLGNAAGGVLEGNQQPASVLLEARMDHFCQVLDESCEDQAKAMTLSADMGTMEDAERPFCAEKSGTGVLDFIVRQVGGSQDPPSGWQAEMNSRSKQYLSNMADLLALPAEDLAFFDLHSAAGATEGMLTVLGSRDLLLKMSDAPSSGHKNGVWPLLKMCLFRSNGSFVVGPQDSSLTAAALLRGQQRGSSSFSPPSSWLAHAHLLHKESSGRMLLNGILSRSASGTFNVRLAAELLSGALLELRTAAITPELQHAAFGRRLNSTSDNQADKFGNVELADWVFCIVEFAFDQWLEHNSAELNFSDVLTSCTRKSLPVGMNSDAVSLLCGTWLFDQFVDLLNFPNLSFRYLVLRKLDRYTCRLRNILHATLSNVTTNRVRTLSTENAESLQSLLLEVDLVPFCFRQLRVRLTAEPWDGRMYFSVLTHATLSLLHNQQKLKAAIDKVLSQFPQTRCTTTPICEAPGMLEFFDTSSSSTSICLERVDGCTFLQLQLRRVVGNPVGMNVYPAILEAGTTPTSAATGWDSMNEGDDKDGAEIQEADASEIIAGLQAKPFLLNCSHVAAVCGSAALPASDCSQDNLAIALANVAKHTAGPWRAAISDIFGMIQELPVQLLSLEDAVAGSTHAKAWTAWKHAELQLLQEHIAYLPKFKDVASLVAADKSFVALWCAAHVLGYTAAYIQGLMWGFPICVDSPTDFSAAIAAGGAQGGDKPALQCVWAIQQFLVSFARKVREADWGLFDGSRAELESLLDGTDHQGTPLAQFLAKESLWRSVAITQANHITVHRLASSTTYLLRARKIQADSSGLRASVWTQPQAIRTAAPPGFTWDVQPMLKQKPLLLQAASTGSSVAGDVTISKDGLSISHTASESWSMVSATVGFSSGINRWSVRIDRTPTAYLFIGVARITANPHVFLGGDQHGWGFLGDRALYHDRNKARTYGRRFGVHDVIGCELNCDEGTLSFSLNGAPLGIAFRNLTGVLYPAVSFYNHGQKVTLIQQPAIDLVEQPEEVRHQRTASGCGTPPLPPKVNVDMRVLAAPHLSAMCCPGACPGAHILGAPVGNVRPQLLAHVSQLLSTLGGSSTVQKSFIQLVLAAYSAGRLFLDGDLARSSTASGFDVSLNAGTQALHPFGVTAGDRIMCKLGECTVKGVRDGRLWVQPLDSKHVWYLVQHQVSGGLAATSDTLSWAVCAKEPASLASFSVESLQAEAASLPLWHWLTSCHSAVDGQATKRHKETQNEGAAVPTEATSTSAISSHGVPPPPVVQRAAFPQRPASTAAASARKSASAASWSSNADRRSECGIILLQPADDLTLQAAIAYDFEASWMLIVNGVGKSAHDDSLVAIPSIVQYWQKSSFDTEVVQFLRIAANLQATENLFALSAPEMLAALSGQQATDSSARHLKQLRSAVTALDDCPGVDSNLVISVLEKISPHQLCVARALFLYQLNDCLAPCMPIFNMRARHNWQGPLQKEILRGHESQDLPFSMHQTLGWNAIGELTALRDVGQVDAFDVVQHCRAIKEKLFPRIKQQVLNTVLSRTNMMPPACDDEFEHPPELPRLVIDRPGAARALQLTEGDQRLLGSVFGQLMRSLAWVPTAYLRLGYSHPMDDNQLRAFYVSFLGEGVDDYGGAYREVFTQAIAELQTHITGGDALSLPVLQASPNAASGLGSNRGWFVAASGKGSSDHVYPGYELSMPRLLLTPLQASAGRFTGNILGMAIRGRILLDLQLADCMWRLLANDPVNIESMPQILVDQLPILPETQQHDGLPVWLLSLQELRAMDHSAASLLDQLLRIYEQAQASPEDMGRSVTSIPDLTFSTYLSGGKQVPLVVGGASQNVRVCDIPKFALYTLAARALEGFEMVQAIRAGMVDVVSDALLPLLTGPELRDTLCGAEDFDVDLLKRNTEYEEGLSSTDEHVQFLWDALRNMSAGERAAFLRFVWARARLPPSDAAFTQKFKLQKFEPAGLDGSEEPILLQQRRDAMLPKSSTCFGALYLPKYSSASITLARLNYAAKHCISMDADFLTGQDEVGNW